MVRLILPSASPHSPLALIPARRQVKSLLLTDSSVTESRQARVMRDACDATRALGGGWGSLDRVTSISSQGVSKMPSSLVTCWGGEVGVISLYSLSF